MKKFILLLFLLFPVVALAETVKLQWDAMPADQFWTEVRIYERIGASAPYQYSAILATSAPPSLSATFEISDKEEHRYIARSYNGQRESYDSNTAVLLAAPSPPGNLRISLLIAAGAGLIILWLLFRKRFKN